VNGYTKEEAIGQPLALVHGSETDPTILRKSEEQLREGRSQEYSVLHYRKDGSHYQCITTRAPLVDANGKSEYLISIWRVVAEARPAGADKVWQPGCRSPSRCHCMNCGWANILDTCRRIPSWTP
jgi:hypothetical protein